MAQYCLHCGLKIKADASVVEVELTNSPDVVRQVHTSCYGAFRLGAPSASILAVFAPLPPRRKKK